MMKPYVLPGLIGLLSFGGPSGARTLEVPSPNYPTIQAAIDDANENAGDDVHVAPYAYGGFGNYNLDFRGKGITVRSSDPNDPNVVAGTIIDCKGLGRGVVFQTGEGPNSVLWWLTITNGSAGDFGGGIECYNSSPTIRHCIIRDSSAPDDGAGHRLLGRLNILTK